MDNPSGNSCEIVRRLLKVFICLFVINTPGESSLANLRNCPFECVFLIGFCVGTFQQ